MGVIGRRRRGLRLYFHERPVFGAHAGAEGEGNDLGGLGAKLFKPIGEGEEWESYESNRAD